MTEPSFAIGIAGGTGAGKTAVANELTAPVDGASVLPPDDYYEDHSHLPAEERAGRNYDHPDAFEWELPVEQLDRLLDGDPIRMPGTASSVTSVARSAESSNRRRQSSRGLLTLYDPRIRDRVDLNVYVQTDADVGVLRRLERDVVEQYLATVEPMHEQFVEPTKRHADVIVPEGANREAVGLLVERVRAETDAGTLDFDLSAHRGPGGRPRRYHPDPDRDLDPDAGGD